MTLNAAAAHKRALFLIRAEEYLFFTEVCGMEPWRAAERLGMCERVHLRLRRWLTANPGGVCPPELEQPEAQEVPA